MATGVPSQALSTNPIVTKTHVFATIDSPGIISCLERSTGNLVWSKQIGKFAIRSPEIHRGKLYAISEKAIHAIDPSSGNELWVHAPYEDKGEWIYAGLCFHGNRVFYGDVTGHFQCLNTETGQLLWRVLINSSDNRMVNSTATIEGKAVIAATNEGFLVAMDKQNGKELWRTKIDGPSCHPIHRFKKFAISEAQSTFFFDPRTGKILKKFRWKNREVSKCFECDGKLFLLLEYPVEEERNAQLLVLKGLRAQKSISFDSWATCISLSNDEKCIYIYNSGLLDIYCSKTLERLASICGLSGRIARVSDGVLYNISMSGRVSAIRLPPTERAKSKKSPVRFKFPKAFSPSQYLGHLIEGRTAEECAERLGWTLESFDELIRGKRKITQADSIALGEKVFGPSADLWIRLQKQWDLQNLG